MKPLKFSDVAVVWAGLTFGMFLPLLFNDALMAERLGEVLRRSYDMGFALAALFIIKRWVFR